MSITSLLYTYFLLIYLLLWGWTGKVTPPVWFCRFWLEIETPIGLDERFAVSNERPLSKFRVRSFKNRRFFISLLSWTAVWPHLALLLAFHVYHLPPLYLILINISSSGAGPAEGLKVERMA